MARENTEMYFNVESGRLILTDPCYDKDTRGGYEVEAVNGQWVAEVRYKDTGAWGERVCSIFAVSIDYNASYDDHEISYVDGLGVDSGQMSIWDAEDYTTDEWRYHLIGYGDGTDRPANGTLNSDMCYRDDRGVACQSGYGDGEYEAVCYHLDDDDSPVIAVEIRFC